MTARPDEYAGAGLNEIVLAPAGQRTLTALAEAASPR